MMEIELYRLASFMKWPQETELGPLSLARNGFWYSGKDDEVECFSCKGRFRARENPQQKHQERISTCEYLRNAAVNVPMKAGDLKKRAAKTEPDGCRGDVFTDDGGAVGPRTRNNDSVELHDALIEIYDSAYRRATKNGLFRDQNNSEIDRSRPDYELLKMEEIRLRTFYDWPSTANAKPVELAREGFFYTGSGDRVQCAFCKDPLSKWESTDVPSEEHRKHSPNCPFVRGLNVGNVPIATDGCINTVDWAGTSPEQQPRITASNIVTEEPIRESPTIPALDPLALISGDPPKFPDYRNISARVESFRKGIVGQGQTPEGLADAGWFYVGPNDKVRCFQCGGNLRDWEPEDDPWVEHKRWYDYCHYTKTHKPAPRMRAPEAPLPMMPTSAVNYRIEPREVKARMDTPTVRAILDMGYSREKVRAVIETRLSTTGDDFLNAESLLDALFQLEEAVSAAQTGATASGLTVATANNSVYNYPSSPASSRTSGQSTASSSASDPLHQPEFASMPVIGSNGASVSNATVATDNKTGLLKPESSAMRTILEGFQSKAKVGKKRKNKKKKQTSEAAASDATGEEDAAAAAEDANEATQNDPEKDGEKDGELGLDEIPDEESIKYLEENRQLREARTCKVCMDSEVNTVFLPCGHLVCCAACSPHLRTCPICRTFIRGTVKTFLS